MVRDPRDRYAAVVERRPQRRFALPRSTHRAGSRSAALAVETWRAIPTRIGRSDTKLSSAGPSRRSATSARSSTRTSSRRCSGMESEAAVRRRPRRASTDGHSADDGVHRSLPRRARSAKFCVRRSRRPPRDAQVGLRERHDSGDAGRRTMSTWHTIVDSDSFRRFAKRGPGRRFFRSATFRSLNVRRNR